MNNFKSKFVFRFFMASFLFGCLNSQPLMAATYKDDISPECLKKMKATMMQESRCESASVRACYLYRGRYECEGYCYYDGEGVYAFWFSYERPDCTGVTYTKKVPIREAYPNGLDCGADDLTPQQEEYCAER